MWKSLPSAQLEVQQHMFFKSPSFFNGGEELAMRPVLHCFQTRKPTIKGVSLNMRLPSANVAVYI